MTLGDDVYRFFFDEYDLPSFILNKAESPGDFIISDINKKALEAEGIKKEDYTGRSFPKACAGFKSSIFCSTKKEEIITILNKLTCDTGYKRYSYFAHCNLSAYTKSTGEVIFFYDLDYENYPDYEDLKIKARELEIVLEKLPIGVWFADKNGKLVFANPAGEGIWSEKKFVGTKDYGVFKAWFYDTKKPVGADDWALVRTIKNREIIERELLEIESFDGKRKIIYNWTLPVTEDNGDLLGAVIINQEVTDSIKAREALEESEERFRSLINYSQDLVTIINPDGTIRYQSPSAKNLLGYEHDSLIGEHLIDYIHPDDVKNVMEQWENVLKKSGEFSTPPVRFKRSDGSYAYIESVATNLVDNPVISGVLLNSRDVTIRYEAEESIKKNRKNFYDIVRQLPMPLLLQDKDRKTLYLNAEFEKLFGYNIDEISDCEEWFLLAYPDDDYRHFVRKGWDIRPGRGENTGDEDHIYDVTCKDGTVKKIHFMTVHLDDGRVIVLMQDLTERYLSIEREKAALIQIEDNIQKLSILNDSIRNPLAVIVGIADMSGGRENEIILDQAKEIDKTIDELDRGWIESAKIREYLIKHYGHEKKKS